MQPENLEFWIDLNLPPALANWLRNDFHVFAQSFKDLGFESIQDVEVYREGALRMNTIIITTKDIDFVNLSRSIRSQPKILYLNVGNISNKELRKIINKSFQQVIELFVQTDNTLVEITI